MVRRQLSLLTLIYCLVAMLTGCAWMSSKDKLSVGAGDTPSHNSRANDVVIYALGLVETGYQFGGKNPEAGLDCSGMVSHVFAHAAGRKITGSAADMARQGRAIERTALRPGDLVFFNTTGTPYSHVGIYIGDQRFVHAPKTGGKVRTDSIGTGWFAARVQATRRYFD